MTASDPQLAEIVTRFETFEVQAGRGGYTLRHRASHAAVARLRPIPDSDRFELFHWSAVRGAPSETSAASRSLSSALTRSFTQNRSSTSKRAEPRSIRGQGSSASHPQNGLR